MTLVAGVDIGNATTEIVIVDTDTLVPVAWDRRPTREAKGSAASGRAAASLLARMEHHLGRRVDRAVLTPQFPVHTMSADLSPVPPDIGRLAVLASTAATPGGRGAAAGRPVHVDAEPVAGEDVVLVATDPLGFRHTVARVRAWTDAGAHVVGVLLAGDEASLVSARLTQSVPVVDGVDTAQALLCLLVMVEVAAEGTQVHELTDPIRVSAALGLDADEHDAARAVGTGLLGARACAVGVLPHRAATRVLAGPEASLQWADGHTVPLREAAGVLAAARPGGVRGLRLDDAAETAVSDLWLVDLARVARHPGLMPGSVARQTLVLSALMGGDAADDHVTAFAAEWPGPVVTAASEASAGRRGALTTPGAAADATVVDLGGGTVDLTPPPVTAAGSGALLTAAVADALGISAGTAEWVKRGPATRIESPHLAVRENGERTFLEASAPPGSVGWLVAPGPSGWLPFARHLSLAEWRTVRWALKRAVFADNLRRLLTEGMTTDVLLVGGPAGDHELVQVLNEVLDGAVVGRGDVAGVLGHRWAVAYGLVLAHLAEGDGDPEATRSVP